jgi:uncharacterized protein
MAIELYDLSVPAFRRGFASLSAILDKGRAHADAEGIAHADYLGARLYEDMHPLTAQVQRASDAAKFAVARLSGVESPAMADTEASFDALQDRIARTLTFLDSVRAETINGKEAAQIEVKTPARSLHFTGRDYLLGFALPNFYFHVTTAYAILRHLGVPIGKMDYLGSR